MSCRHCGGSVEQRGLGRPRVYCSVRCKNKGPMRSKARSRAGDRVQATMLYAVTKPASCHSDRSVLARGLCSPCYHRVRRSGLDPERAVAEPINDVGPCDICGTVAKRVIDHDHDSGQMRGQLCDGCNLGIGCFADDPDRLERAAKYLRNHIATAERCRVA